MKVGTTLEGFSGVPAYAPSRLSAPKNGRGPRFYGVPAIILDRAPPYEEPLFEDRQDDRECEEAIPQKACTQSSQTAPAHPEIPSAPEGREDGEKIGQRQSGIRKGYRRTKGRRSQ